LYEHENDYSRAVGSYDLEMSANPSAALQVDLAKVCLVHWNTDAYCAMSEACYLKTHVEA